MERSVSCENIGFSFLVVDPSTRLCGHVLPDGRLVLAVVPADRRPARRQQAADTDLGLHFSLPLFGDEAEHLLRNHRSLLDYRLCR